MELRGLSDAVVVGGEQIETEMLNPLLLAILYGVPEVVSFLV